VKDGKEQVHQETDSVRSGVTVPYSPEFADMESNAPLLERLRALTGGSSYKDDDVALAEAASSGAVFRHTDLAPSRNLQPIWYWLLLLASILLFFDVAVRRIALDPSELTAAGRRTWDRIRRRSTTTVEPPQFLERLKSRKAQVDESLERARGARRFETTETASAAPAGAHDVPQATAASPLRAGSAAGLAPKKEEEATDYASRLLKAKQRVWKEREKGKEPPA